MQVAPVKPIYQPRWVMTKPHVSIDRNEVSLVPVDLVFEECSAPRESSFEWKHAAIWIGGGTVCMYITLTICIAFFRMVSGI